MRYLIVLSLLFLSPSITQAETNQPTGTRINLSATAEQSVSNDEMIVYYRVEEKGSSAKQLRQKVNQITARLEARLKSEKVQHKTTGRSFRPHWEKGVFNFQRWNASQSGQIVTQDLDNISSWLGDIEAMGVKLNNLSFRVSSNKMRAVQNELRLQALKKFRTKAASLSKGIMAKSFRIIRVQTSGASQPRYERGPVMMADMAMAKSAAAPVVTAGESRSKVTVSGEIEVPFTNFPVQ
ncbi:oxidative stress defense protein [Mariprofundus micogutta]|uniref:Oxidative stress defense protein n=1 Tax=Mariprofundus micogutta TaxID=1921010 RepID=A0A1L8CMQ2_9PROT|nr:SIMPL domain-containing protein [Mariprofundus micogutta]GAV20187.1 oxidative stress defense protein [Mariprofundus micogutta]